MSLARQYHKIAEYNCEVKDSDAAYRLKMDYQRENVLRVVQTAFSSGKELRILEFGPGMGSLIDVFRSAYPGSEYHIADIDQGALELLTARFAGVYAHFCAGVGDLQNISGQFDVIAAIDVWEHLDLQTAIEYTKWCYSRLRPRGLMVLQVPNWGCPLTPSVFCLDLTHQLMLNEKSFRQLFRAAGLPESSFSVRPRRTPYLLGKIRDAFGGIFGFFYRMVFVFFGAVRLSIFTPDMVAVIRKE